jgi:hypothetical protein
MLPKKKAAYHQLQLVNSVLPAGQKLPKNIIKLIGLYADVPTPAETFLQVKSILEQRSFGRAEAKITGIDLHKLADTTTSQGWRWNSLSNDLDRDNDPLHPSEFETNLEYFLTDLFFPSVSSRGKRALHIALEQNNLDLIKACIKLRGKKLASHAPSDAILSPYQRFKRVIDASDQVHLHETRVPSLLQYAAYLGNLAAYDLMIAAGADLTTGIHPLLFAVSNLQTDFVRTVLAREQHGYVLSDAAIDRDEAESGVWHIHSPFDGHGLLHSALSLFDVNEAMKPKQDEMVNLLVERGISVREYSADLIDLLVESRCINATQIWVQRMGIDKVLTHPVAPLYALIDLLGGYDKVRQLTNTEVTDPKMLTLIFLGIYSQALSSSFITRYSSNFFKQIFDQISPIDPQACERNQGLMVTELQRWYANKPILSPFDPNPMAHMTRGQKSAWGLR